MTDAECRMKMQRRRRTVSSLNLARLYSAFCIYHSALASAARPLPRVHRQVAVGHLQDDQRHAGGVVLAEVAVPVAAVELLAAELVADGGIPARPVLAAGEEHRLDGVVVSVEVVPLVLLHDTLA